MGELTWLTGGLLPEHPAVLPRNIKLKSRGAMFIGEKGRLLLPHFMQLPRKIVDGKYVDISKEILGLSCSNSF